MVLSVRERFDFFRPVNSARRVSDSGPDVAMIPSKARLRSERTLAKLSADVNQTFGSPGFGFREPRANRHRPCLHILIRRDPDLQDFHFTGILTRSASRSPIRCERKDVNGQARLGNTMRGSTVTDIDQRNQGGLPTAGPPRRSVQRCALAGGTGARTTRPRRRLLPAAEQSESYI